MTDISANLLGTDHVLSYLVVSVAAAPALTVGHGGHCRLLENVGRRTRAGVPAPPSHQGAHIVVVLGRVWQADWSQGCKQSDFSEKPVEITVDLIMINIPNISMVAIIHKTDNISLL